MASNTGVYDFSKVIVMINHPLYEGNILINGFMADSTIAIARANPRWTNKPAGDGKSSTLERNPVSAGTITFSLNQSTESLARMNAIAQHANVSDGSDVLFEIIVADKSSGSIHISRDAVVGDPETIEYGGEENGREFVVNCGTLESNLNSAAKVSQETLKILRALGFDLDASRVADY